MIVKECKSFESVAHFYNPLEYTNEIMFLYSLFQDGNLVHCCILCPKNKAFLNFRIYKNARILRERALNGLNEKQRASALSDIRNGTGIKRINDLQYGGNGLFECTYLSQRSLENFIKYFELQEKIFGDKCVMNWDGFNAWNSNPIIPTPFNKEVQRSKGNHLPIIEQLIEMAEKNTLHNMITDFDYDYLDKLLSPATGRGHAGEVLQLRAMELIDHLNFPMYYDQVVLTAHPKGLCSGMERIQNNEIWEKYLIHANRYIQRMEKTYPFLKWDLETAAPQQRSFDDVLIAYMKQAIPNWIGGDDYDDYGRLISPPDHS